MGYFTFLHSEPAGMDRHAIMRALNFPTAAVVAHVQSSRYAQPRDGKYS